MTRNLLEIKLLYRLSAHRSTQDKEAILAPLKMHTFTHVAKAGHTSPTYKQGVRQLLGKFTPPSRKELTKKQAWYKKPNLPLEKTTPENQAPTWNSSEHQKGTYDILRK